MTRAERQDDTPAHQPKPTWGPGKNAALSFVAFAVIFGIFAYAERDTTVSHASVTHDISGVIGAAVGKTRKAIVAATARATEASSTPGTSAASVPAPALAQTTRPPTPQPSASAAPAVSTVPPVTLAIEPEAASRARTRAVAKHRQSSHVPPVTLAANTGAAPAHGRVAVRPGAAHRGPRTETLAGTRKHMGLAPKPPSYGADSVHMQTASITHAELESARALAKARSCAVIDEWNCVEHNASRALAFDPKNSESRALLGQAIRNRL
ncbi:hypothetical protein BLA14095_00097 [Burkholderia lata]|uniref:hypothetical protein n=1 Tax=Burkholderia lata (strain ATCC 17760 / DSM 23089 / LMG 22485 / NCIMB 9086 / R18194 / 383) TaxID=482957 RepID=UPI001452D2E3|nr:hypothetical protein [Burkholderia lata]VWB08657.1 hypothetical protein BLA14095_00097 [Burkholderia lata]